MMLRYAYVFVLALVLCGSLVADTIPAFTTDASNGTTSVVGFGGQQWWVIGQNTEDNTARLLLKSDSSTAGYGKSIFRSSRNSTYTSRPNEYAGSTLQQNIDGIAANLGKEGNYIQARTSADLQNGVGDSPSVTVAEWKPLSDQKLWALSSNEWGAVVGDAASFTGGNFWLRSPSGEYYAREGASGGGTSADLVGSYSLGVRPAFDLDLTNVAGYATLDGGFKFTFYDESLNIGGINEDGTLNLTSANSLLASLGGMDYTLTGSGLFNLNTLGFGGLSDGEYSLLLTAYELNGDLFSDFVGNAFSQTVWIQDGELLFDAPPSDETPEPATLLILGLGLAGLGLARRKRK